MMECQTSQKELFSHKTELWIHSMMMVLGTELGASCWQSQELWPFIHVSWLEVRSMWAWDPILSRCCLTVSCHGPFAGRKVEVSRTRQSQNMHAVASKSGQPLPASPGGRVRVSQELLFVQMLASVLLFETMFVPRTPQLKPHKSQTAGAFCDGPPWRHLAFQGSSPQLQLHIRNTWEL